MALGVRVRDLALPNVDRRMAIGAILAGIAALGVLVLTKPPERVPVLVAGSDLVAGRPLGEMDVQVRYVDSSTGLVTGDSVGDLEEWSLRVPLAEGEPLVASLMQPPEVLASPNVIALSLQAQNAVLGRLVAGDKVDVYMTSKGGIDSQPTTVLLASSVYVVETVVPESTIDRGRVNVLLAVDDELAAQLASASHTGDIDLVRVAP
jgi:Flp pilus assembly protein CpaB